MLPVDFDKRLELAQGYSDLRRNGLGTALYLTGVVNDENSINPERAYEEHFERQLASCEEPEIGRLIVWQNQNPRAGRTFVAHIGVITEIKDDEIFISHRPATGADLEINTPLTEARRGLIMYSEVFYSPKGTERQS